MTLVSLLFILFRTVGKTIMRWIVLSMHHSYNRPQYKNTIAYTSTVYKNVFVDSIEINDASIKYNTFFIQSASNVEYVLSFSEI